MNHGNAERRRAKLEGVERAARTTGKSALKTNDLADDQPTSDQIFAWILTQSDVRIWRPDASSEWVVEGDRCAEQDYDLWKACGKAIRRRRDA